YATSSCAYTNSSTSDNSRENTVAYGRDGLSPVPSPPASASSEGSVEAEIRVLPIPRAPAIPAPPPPPLPEDNEDEGPRKSGRQTKPRDYWQGGFAAFLAMMAVAEAPVHYKDVL